MKLIQSRENVFFKELLKLTSSARKRNKVGQTLLDGVHLLSAYLQVGYKPIHIFLNSAALGDTEIQVLLTQFDDVPVAQLDNKLFSELSELKTPTGILALIALPQPELSISECRFVLFLEDIQDPGNLGSILRSAGAAGCDSVFLSSGCVDAWSPKVLRAAMGGHFCLNIFEHQDLQAVAAEFSGMRLATSLQATLNIYQTRLTGNLAFMIGNEGAGLSDSLMKLASDKITIPMPGQVESLNAAAATAICLFEAVRQRQFEFDV